MERLRNSKNKVKTTINQDTQDIKETNKKEYKDIVKNSV